MAMNSPAKSARPLEVRRRADESLLSIRWDDGHESIYTPAAGALRKAETAETS